MKKKLVWTLLMATVPFLILAACDRAEDIRTETRIIEAGGAESAEVRIRMGAGELHLSGGAAALMESRFSSNARSRKPEISYDILDKKGVLTIRQKRSKSFRFGHRHNDWTILLNNSLPLDLQVSLGAGESRLDFRDTCLKSLDMNMGVGSVDLDLRDPKKSLDVRISGGVGSATIRLPRTIGVLAEIHGGIGSVSASGFTKSGHSYTNEAYGRTPEVIHLSVQAGIGSVHLKLE